MKTQMIHTRIDPDLKHQAEQVLKTLGINTADAIRMFLTQVTLQKALPFDLRIPNAQTRQAIEDSEKGIGMAQYASWDELAKDCN